jgi:multidrug resistance efflux pump
MNGKLKSVLVEEGSRVRQGQIVAVLENGDYRARVAFGQALLSQREAELRRVINGATEQERSKVRAEMEEAEAVLKNSQLILERRQILYQRGAFAREAADLAERDYQVSKARYEAAAERYSQITDKAREEDLSQAQANVRLAQAQLDESRVRLEKTSIRSPITGTVLRQHLKAGETAAASPDMPIVTIANLGTLRVRVDVDETDIGKVRLGLRSYVQADAYGDTKFWGRVVRISQVLGKKNFRTDEPTERVDTKILETLVELDDHNKLPPGLRVNVFILSSEASLASP